MSRFAKLSLALLAVLAMVFLIPGLARADDAATPTNACDAVPAPDGCPAAGAGSNAGTAPGSSDLTTRMGAQPEAVVPNAVTDVPQLCTDPSRLADCIPPCQLDAFKDLPVCKTTTPPPPGPCEKVADLANGCKPDCAFLAHLLGMDGCPTPPDCLDLSQLPSGTPEFTPPEGLPVCQPSTTPPPPTTSSGDVYYENCDDAEAHGASNIPRGQPGYRSALDRDDDGIACESSTSTGTTGTPKTPETPKAPTPQIQAAPVAGQLAYTGAVPAPMAAAGFGFVLGGAALLRLSRRAR